MSVSTVRSGVTTAQGFRAAGLHAGIKPRGSDLALLVSDVPATAAAVFTTNLAQAAPVVVSREHLTRSGGAARAIIVNSGCANACTGDEGLQAARDMAELTARLVECPVEQVLVASTGVIGVPLDEKRIVDSLPKLVAALAPESFDAVARAILTTDTVPKTASAEVRLKAGTVRIAGMVKGAGMIHPRMATMLAFLFTDADLRPAELKPMLAAAVERSFNRISVDGDTSTDRKSVV